LGVWVVWCVACDVAREVRGRSLAPLALGALVLLYGYVGLDGMLAWHICLQGERANAKRAHGAANFQRNFLSLYYGDLSMRTFLFSDRSRKNNPRLKTLLFER
jgi:hypothetical protein